VGAGGGIEEPLVLVRTPVLAEALVVCGPIGRKSRNRRTSCEYRVSSIRAMVVGCEFDEGMDLTGMGWTGLL
jgi:hypothetical protein